MALETRKWDAANYLETREDIASYLDAILEDGDPRVFKAALDDIARSEGMAKIAAEANLSRTSLYKALSPDTDPRLSTIVDVLKALGMRLSVVDATA